MVRIFVLVILMVVLIYHLKQPKTIRKCENCKYFYKNTEGCIIEYMNQQSVNDYKICQYTDKEFKTISKKTDFIRSTQPENHHFKL